MYDRDKEAFDALEKAIDICIYFGRCAQEKNDRN